MSKGRTDGSRDLVLRCFRNYSYLEEAFLAKTLFVYGSHCFSFILPIRFKAKGTFGGTSTLSSSGIEAYFHPRSLKKISWRWLHSSFNKFLLLLATLIGDRSLFGTSPRGLTCPHLHSLTASESRGCPFLKEPGRAYSI